MKRAFLVVPLFYIASTIAILSCLLTPVASAQRFQAAQEFAVGPFAQNVFVADFNNDGRPDLLVIDNPGASNVPTTLQVLLGNGDGTFQPAINTQGIDALAAIAIGDFNRDGILDIAMCSEFPPGGVSNIGTITIFLGKGDGTFAASPQTMQTGNVPSFMKAVDLNGDGILDLLVVNSGDNTVSAFKGKGDGTFTLAGTQSYSSGMIDSALGLAVADFDGDGIPDVVVSLAGSFAVLKGNGDGTFQSPVSTSLNMAGGTPGLIAAVDFNGDGKQDLIVVSFPSTLLLAGKGDLTFQPPVVLSNNSFANGIAIADMDGDGHPDIVLLESTSGFGVTLLFNDGTGGIASTQTYAAPQSSFAVADLNGDGHPDIVFAGFGAAPSAAGVVQVVLNNGNGTMHAALRLNIFGRAVVADFNNDGKLDIGNANGIGEGVLVNSGNFQFAALQPFISAPVGFPVDAVAGDLNGDGNQDLVAVGTTTRGGAHIGSMAVLLGNGDGGFTAAPVQPPALPAPLTLHRIAAGDFNGDGKLDVVVTNMDTNSTTVGVFLGNGDGTFQPVSLVTAGSLLTGIVVGDFNGDGHLDIAVTNKGDGTNPSTVSILLGNGDGTFTLGTPVNVGVEPVALAVGDVNGDGKLDLVVSNNGNGKPGSVSVLMGNGDGTFQPAVTLSSFNASLGALTLADFNGDGFLDIAVAENGSLIDLFTNNGKGTFPQNPERYGIGGNPDFLIAADLNNGGLPDLLTSSNMNVLINRGGAAISLTSSQNPSATGETVTFSASVVPNVPGVPAATGTVQFFDGSSALGTVALSSGTAVFSTSTLAGGPHTIRATYSGDTNYRPRTFANLSQAVRASTVVTVTSSANPSVFGSPITINLSVTSNAAGTPTGNVSLLDGITVIGSTALDGSGNASFALPTLTGGTHNLTARYAGDQIFLASVSNPPLAQVVNPVASTSSVSSSANPSTFGSSVTFTIKVNGVNSVLPTGTVSLLEGLTTLASTTLASGAATFQLGNLGGGTHNLTASYAGDQNYTASVSANLAQVINQAATSASISSSPNPVSYATGFVVTVAVTGPNAIIPTGNVSLLDGSSTLGSAALDSSGKATFQLASLSGIGFGLGAGTHNFTASYAGGQNFAASVSPVLQEVITKASSFTDLGIAPNPGIQGNVVSFSAAVSPTAGGVPGAVSLLDGSTVIATGSTDANGVFNFNTSTLTLGSHLITANYAGDTNRTASNSQAVSLTIFPTDFSITASTSAATVNAGQSTGAVITVFSNPSFTNPLTLSCSGLPALAACSFNPATINPNATFQSSTLTIITTGPSAMSSPPGRFGSRSSYILTSFLPGFAALLFFVRNKKRPAPRIALLIVLLLSLALLSNCGGSMATQPQPKTPDGTSTIVVIASAPGGNGVTHQVTLTLTVKN